MNEPLIDWLLRPETYPEPTTTVTLVETHISWVFLTDQFAYKLKKPVKFDFLDFSTAELRRAACEDEVRLNRRLAAHVYLGVVAVRRDERGELFFHESADAHEDPVLDWLVKMQRLPADRTLDAMARSGELSDGDLMRLAERLAKFYRHTEHPSVTPAAYRAAIARHVRANRAALLSAAADESESPAASITLIKRLHRLQLQLIAFAPGLFDSRVAGGWIVDGHGDLRPEHIYLLPEPVVIDCIEFSAEFRRLDIADELSFLATECDFIGAQVAGQVIPDRCLQLLDDAPPDELLAFYRTYRACVRAKVAELRAGQLEGTERAAALEQVGRHLRLAEGYAEELLSLLRPILFVVHGLTGSGKSTLAAALADELGAKWLSTDTIRRQMFGASPEPAAYGKGNYEPAQRLAVYDSLFNVAERNLADGLSVVLDGTFLRAELRRRATELARQYGAIALLVHCSCPEEVARLRIAARVRAGQTTSEARPELLERQKADEEPPTLGLPGASPSSTATVKHVEIMTTDAIKDQIALVIGRLRDG